MMNDTCHKLNLDLDLLRTFVAVADLNTFGAAAVSISRTQSAVSQQMQRLESLVNRPLFMRLGRKKRLTEEGIQLLGFARNILRCNDQACLAMNTGQLEETLTLWIADDAEEIFFASPLALIRTLYPRMNVEFAIKNDPFLSYEPAGKQADLIVSTYRPLHYNALLLSQRPTFWYCARQFTVHRGKALPLVMVKSPLSYRDAILDQLNRAGVAWYINYEAPSLKASRDAVRAGLGIAAWPLRMATDEQVIILGSRDGLPELNATLFYLCLHHENSRETAKSVYRAFASQWLSDYGDSRSLIQETAI